MKKTNHKELNIDDLMKSLEENREKLHLCRFGAAGGKTKNVKEGMVLKREIARILTELKNRENK